MYSRGSIRRHSSTHPARTRLLPESRRLPHIHVFPGSVPEGTGTVRSGIHDDADPTQEPPASSPPVCKVPRCKCDGASPERRSALPRQVSRRFAGRTRFCVLPRSSGLARSLELQAAGHGPPAFPWSKSAEFPQAVRSAPRMEREPDSEQAQHASPLQWVKADLHASPDSEPEQAQESIA